MNQTSLIGRPLARLATAVAGFAEKRGVWSGPLMSSSPELARLWAAPSSGTGVSVTEMSALTYSTVWACVNNISTDVSSLPLGLFKRLPNGGNAPLMDHKLHRILHDEPNPEMHAMTFRGTVQAHALTWGNGYAEIVRDGAGRVAELWPITPDRVSVQRNTRTGVLFYQVSRPDGGLDALPASEMFHLEGLGYDGSVGYNVIAQAREAIALALATERFGGTFFGNGTTFGGVIALKEQLTEQAKKSFREQMAAQHQGVEQAHKFLLLGNEATYERLGIPPDNAQFLETRLNQVEEICRYFRMPPHKVQHLIRTSYNSVEQLNIEYSTDTIRPWCVRWEHEIKRKLIAPSERLIQFAKHKMDAIQRGDLASRNASYAVGRQWGWLSVDDIREREDLNPLPDKQGEIYLVPQNMAPADRINDIVDKQVEPTPAPAPVAGRAEEAAHVAQEIRTALTEVETRIAATTAQITTAEADVLQWKTSAGGFEADATGLRAQLATEQQEAGSLRVLLAEATQRADRLTLEQETERAAKEAVTAQLAERDATLAETTAAQVAAHQRAERLQAERDGLETQRAESAAALDLLTVQHADAVAVLHAATETERAAAAQRVAAVEAQIQTTELECEARALELTLRDADLTATKTREATLTAELEALRAQAETAVDAVKVADASVRATEDAAAQAATIHAAKLKEEQAARTELEKQLADIQAYRETLLAQVETLTAQATTATHEAQAARAEAVEAQTLKTAAEALVAERDATLAAAQTARVETETALQARQAAHATHLQALLTAQRDLVIDVMERLVRVESDRARRNQSTPAKIKAWAEAFYPMQEDRYLEALRPVMRAHLAFMQSTQDVDAYIRTLIAPQLTAAVVQIRTLADGDSEDFAPSLDRIVTKWEKDRPVAIADRVFQEEMTYVRSI